MTPSSNQRRAGARNSTAGVVTRPSTAFIGAPCTRCPPAPQRRARRGSGGVRGTGCGRSSGGGSGAAGRHPLAAAGDEADDVEQPVLIGAEDEVIGAGPTDRGGDVGPLLGGGRGVALAQPAVGGRDVAL